MRQNPYDNMVPLDFGEMKCKYIADRLSAAGFCILASCEEGVVMVATNSKIELRKKIFEVHYKMAGARIGYINEASKLSELIMNAADGMQMNESLSDVNALAKAVSGYLSEVFNSSPQPIIFKFMLAEVGDVPEEDIFVELRCDGFLNNYKRFCVLGETYEKDNTATASQTKPLTSKELEMANLNAGMIKKANEGLKTIFTARAAAKEIVGAKDILRLALDIWGESSKIEAVILSREQAEGCERHFRRLSKEEIQEMVK